MSTAAASNTPSEHRGANADPIAAQPHTASDPEKDGSARDGSTTSRDHDSDDDDRFRVEFTGDDDPRSPKSMSSLRKWLIVTIVSSSSLCVACTSSLYTGAMSQIEDDFHVSEEVATLGLSIFVV
jgi:hypothetical protein